MEDVVEERGFVLEGEGRDAAENQSDDEEDEPEASAADEAVWGGGRHAPV